MIPNGAERRFPRPNEGSWIVSSDFYLRMAREGIRMLKIEIPLKRTYDIRLYVDSSDSVSVHSEDGMRGIQLIGLLFILKVILQIIIQN